MSAAIRLQGVSVRLGGRLVLDGIDLEVAAGTSLAVVGPNGAGKTVLYRMMMGLGRPSQGIIELFGVRVPARRVRPRVGYMPQNEALYPELSVRENLLFFGRVFGLAGEQLVRRVSEVLELVDLGDRVGDRAQVLSGGMRRRLSLAIALIHEPELIVLDEPTVGIDPDLRNAFWEHFERLESQGRTVVVSTHHLDEAARCERVALLFRGRLLACESTAQLLRRTGSTDLEAAYLALSAEQQ